MKTFHLMLGGFMLTGLTAEAQTTESASEPKGKITINIEKESNGKKTVIDTTFDLNDQQALQDFLQKQDVKVHVYNNEGPDQRIMKYKFNDGDGSSEKEITIQMAPPFPAKPGAPIPPLPSGGYNENVQVYSYSLDGDEGKVKLDELEKLMEDAFGKDMKVSKEIRRMEIRQEQPERKRKSKKNTRKIIIIEEA